MKTGKTSIHLSKRGLPCLWESGGAYNNTGESFLIADKNGMPKTAIYVRRSGQLACKEHALIPVVVGDITVEADHHRGDFTISIGYIIEINKQEKSCVCEIVNTFSEGEWDFPLEKKHEAVVDAAKRKAKSYHCRHAIYTKD